MIVTTFDIATVLIGFIICFIIAAFARNYVIRNCMDNPEIIWIWLDDDNDQNGGIRVREKAESFSGPRFLAPSVTVTLY